MRADNINLNAVELAACLHWKETGASGPELMKEFGIKKHQLPKIVCYGLYLVKEETRSKLLLEKIELSAEENEINQI